MKRWVKPLSEEIWPIVWWCSAKEPAETASFQAFQAGRSLGVIYHSFSWLKASLKGRGTCFIRVSCWECLVGAVFSSGYANCNNSHLCMQAETHRHPCWLLAYEAAKEIKLFLDVLKPKVGKIEGFPDFGKETSQWFSTVVMLIQTGSWVHFHWYKSLFYSVRFTFWEIGGFVLFFIHFSFIAARIWFHGGEKKVQNLN